MASRIIQIMPAHGESAVFFRLTEEFSGVYAAPLIGWALRELREDGDDEEPYLYTDVVGLAVSDTVWEVEDSDNFVGYVQGSDDPGIWLDAARRSFERKAKHK